MAWIESHQEIAHHPKTKRLAKRLGVSIPTAIGHLHLLWWWALDYAQDGNLTDYSEVEIAEAAGWEGDPSEFVDGLLHCGVNGSFGFLEPDDRAALHIHDWQDYAGRLVQRRQAAIERTRMWRVQKANVTHNERIRCAATVPNSTSIIITGKPDSVVGYEPTESPASETVGTAATVPHIDSPDSPDSPDVSLVWKYYLENIQPHARICPKSRIRTRLKRFSVDQLKEAMDHFRANHWWFTTNRCQGGDWFFKSDSQIDRFLLLPPETSAERDAKNHKGRPSSQFDRPEVETI